MVVTISVCALVGMLLLDVYSELRLRPPRGQSDREYTQGL